MANVSDQVSYTLDGFSPSVNLSTMAPSVTNTTPEEEVAKEIILMFEFCKWCNGFIILLGLITNTLIIVVLSRSKIGSVTTKIILLFLAANDLIVMLVNLFLFYIPHFHSWFPVFYKGTCGLAVTTQSIVVTSASWYITLMTAERFIVVWMPMKARSICTTKTVTIICCLIPVLCSALYAYNIPNWIAYDHEGYTRCKPKSEQGAEAFKAITQLWITVYFFVPGVIILVLNTAIVVKLKSSRALQRKLTQKSSCYHAAPTSSTKPSSASRPKNKNKKKASSTIRKATLLVIIASVTFLILMIPRGIATTIVFDINWAYKSTADQLFDMASYQLQYLNHATNFFIYILANAAFRRELMKIFCRKCLKKQEPSLTTMYTEMNSTSYHRVAESQLSANCG